MKKTKLVKWVLILLPVLIAAIVIADVIFINNFNSRIYTAEGNAEDSSTHFFLDTRKDNTSAWLKRDFDLNGETVDLEAQTFDGTVSNNAAYQVSDWSFILQVKDECFINNAWCGTVEIHQHANTEDETVQTLDLRECDEKDIKLEHEYDGDLLIYLYPGDYIVYHPSAKDDELPLDAHTELEMGMILYYLDTPDLSDYTMTYQYHRSYTDSRLFYIGVAVALIWILILDGFLIARISYQSAVKEMEMKKSGISAMSDIYSIIYIIDLKKNELIPVVADKESEKLRPKELSAQKQLRNLFEWDSSEIYKEAVIDFCNLETVAARLGDRNTMICEYVSKNYGWCQLRFFAMERGTDNELKKLIFTIQVINEEKEQIEALNAEIEEKTENIIYIQQKVVVGLANIIENRDNNTGGHVKRTSDVIRIIVNAMQRRGNVEIAPDFASDIMRAAPMHDLGKISIDSSILCKPGRLTDEEFAIMKTHSAKSGQMVMLLLDGVEEKHFVDIAFNIARHHHERWDGKGYPDRLKGEDIPIEARIMAVADVYDALVSKRCYKEAMSFDKAYSIMIEGMGSQFDPHMKEVFEDCHRELEEYYKNSEA